MADLENLLHRQASVITRKQSLEHLSESELGTKLGRDWRVVLPGVYVAHTGPLNQRQRLWVGVLYAGDSSMIDDLPALAVYGVHYLPSDPTVRVLVDASVQRQSRDFVAVRRTIYLPRHVLAEGEIRVAPISRALTDFALRYDDERTVRAVLASAVQRNQVSTSLLLQDYELAPARGRRRLQRVLEELGAGIRSRPEGDVRRLVATSKVLPEPLYNCLLELPSGRRISPDLLIEEAGLVHETNGRSVHADEDPFDSMQERHDVMTTAGLTVLHNSPRLVERDGPRVLDQLEQCYLRDAGKGMPPGVRIIRRGAG